MDMYINSVGKKELQEFFEGSQFSVVWAESHLYKFKRTRFDSVEEYVHSDIDFKINCPLGGAVRALLKGADGKTHVVNFYDYSVDVLNSDARDEIRAIYLKGMAKKFGREYVDACKQNNENIESLRTRFVERYGKRSIANSKMTVKIPLELTPNFAWANGYSGGADKTAVAQFSQNISQMSRKLEMQLSVKDFIK